MSLWREFWKDESGAVVSTELVAVGTVAVVGGTVGLNQVRTSLNGELQEMAFSVRSLNQSYAVAGQASCRAWTAGSCYVQPDAEQSIAELRALADQPVKKQPAPKKRKPAKTKQRRAEVQEEENTFLLPQESESQLKDPVEPADDASQVEVVIEPAPDA